MRKIVGDIRERKESKGRRWKYCIMISFRSSRSDEMPIVDAPVTEGSIRILGPCVTGIKPCVSSFDANALALVSRKPFSPISLYGGR